MIRIFEKQIVNIKGSVSETLKYYFDCFNAVEDIYIQNIQMKNDFLLFLFI